MQVGRYLHCPAEEETTEFREIPETDRPVDLPETKDTLTTECDGVCNLHGQYVKTIFLPVILDSSFWNTLPSVTRSSRKYTHSHTCSCSSSSRLSRVKFRNNF